MNARRHPGPQLGGANASATAMDSLDVVRSAADAAKQRRPPLLVLDLLEAYLDAEGLGSGPVTASDGIHDTVVTDDSSRMAPLAFARTHCRGPGGDYDARHAEARARPGGCPTARRRR